MPHILVDDFDEVRPVVTECCYQSSKQRDLFLAKEHQILRNINCRYDNQGSLVACKFSHELLKHLIDLSEVALLTHPLDELALVSLYTLFFKALIKISLKQYSWQHVLEILNFVERQCGQRLTLLR